MIDIKKNPETVGKLKVGTSSATPADGQILVNGGAKTAPGYSFGHTTATGMYSPGANQIRFSTASTDRLTISSTGDISLPTAGKTIKTDLSSGGTTRTSSIELYNPSTAAISLKTNNSSSGGIEFWTQGAKRLDVQRNGICTFSGGITVSGGTTTLGSFSELTIASGGITVTSSVHSVDTQNDDASDNLNTINGGSNGSILTLRSVTGARNVTLKDSSDNLKLSGDFTLTSANDSITLIKYGSTWIEISRSDNN